MIFFPNEWIGKTELFAKRLVPDDYRRDARDMRTLILFVSFCISILSSSSEMERIGKTGVIAKGFRQDVRGVRSLILFMPSVYC